MTPSTGRSLLAHRPHQCLMSPVSASIIQSDRRTRRRLASLLARRVYARKPEDAAIAETDVRTESGFDGTVVLRVVLIFVDGTDVVVYRSIVRWAQRLNFMTENQTAWLMSKFDGIQN